MGYIINKEIWKQEFKNRLLLHPNHGLLKIVNGWSETKTVNKFNPFLKNRDVQYLKTIEAIGFNEGTRELRRFYFNNLDINSSTFIDIHLKSWIKSARNIRETLNLIQEWEDKEKSS